jgi:hypothetical protein
VGLFTDGQIYFRPKTKPRDGPMRRNITKPWNS